MAKRIKTVEYDPGWGWIARNPHTGKEILEEGFRWNCRESARTAVWEARHLSAEAKAASGVPVRCKECDLPNGCPEYCWCDAPGAGKAEYASWFPIRSPGVSASGPHPLPAQHNDGGEHG